MKLFPVFILSCLNYYPFGMGMPGRSYTAGNGYRYGFNGKENDNEVKGNGNQQDYGMRIYDTRLGRFLSVDPLTKEYSSWSPYPYAMNRPIDGIDLDGAEWESYLPRTILKRDVVIKPVTEKQLASERFYQAAAASYKAIKYMLDEKVPMLDFDGKDFRSDQYYTMEGYLTSEMNSGVKSNYIKAETGLFISKWLYDLSFLATGTYSQLSLIKTIGDIFELEGASKEDKLDAIQGLIDQSRNEWKGINKAGITFGNILLSYGGATPNVKNLRVSVIKPSTVVTAAKGVLRSFDDVVANPKALWGKSADEVGSILGDGWTKGAYGSSKTGWKFTRSTDGQSIFYHPGGGRHGGSYYGFSSGTLGKTKIVGPDYIPLKGDKSTIINIGN